MFSHLISVKFTLNVRSSYAALYPVSAVLQLCNILKVSLKNPTTQVKCKKKEREREKTQKN